MGYKVLEMYKSLTKGLLTLLLPASLMACGGQPTSSESKDVSSGGLPANAIHVKGSLYMVPVGEDKGPCTIYRTHSTDGAAIAAIHYRKNDGSFVMDKSKSDCRY